MPDQWMNLVEKAMYCGVIVIIISLLLGRKLDLHLSKGRLDVKVDVTGNSKTGTSEESQVP